MPPIGSKGIYEVKEPFDTLLRPNTIYECSAIRYFVDLENNGRDIYRDFYVPHGLDAETYESDRNNRCAIITLTSAKYPPIYIPSSHILKFPSLDIRNYSQVVLMASLGALPDDVVLEPTIQAMQNSLKDFIGVDVSVKVGILPLTDVVSPEQHELREAARLSAIRNEESDYSRVVKLEALNTALQDKISVLELIIKNAGLLD